MEEIKNIVPNKIKITFGDIVLVKEYVSKKNYVSSKYKGMMVGNYPYYILIKVFGKAGNYLKAINKIDLFTGDCEVEKIGGK